MRSCHSFIFIKTILVAQRRMMLDPFIQQTFIEFLPVKWPWLWVFQTSAGYKHTDNYNRVRESNRRYRMLCTIQDGELIQTWRIRECSQKLSYLRIQGTIYHIKATCPATPPKCQVEWIQIAYQHESISQSRCYKGLPYHCNARPPDWSWFTQTWGAIWDFQFLLYLYSAFFQPVLISLPDS